MRVRKSLYLPQVFMIIFGALLLYVIPKQIVDVPGLTVGPRSFPTVLVILIIIISSLSILSNLLKNRKNTQSIKNEENQSEAEPPKITKVGLNRVVISYGLLILWAILLPLIGFIIPTLLTAFLLMYVIGNRSYVKMAIISIVSTTLLYVTATYLLQITF